MKPFVILPEEGMFCCFELTEAHGSETKHCDVGLVSKSVSKRCERRSGLRFYMLRST